MNTRTETQLEFYFMKPEQYTLNLDKNIYSYIDSPSLTLNQPSYTNIVFMNKDNKEVGVLDLSEDTMKFTGDADESAQIFFDNIVKMYTQTKLPFDGWKS